MTATAALRNVAHDVAPFVDPSIALEALMGAETVEVLITCIQVPPGKPNGVALARIARLRRSGIKVLFAADPEDARHAEGLGAFLPMPVDIVELVATVGRLLASDEDAA